MNTRHAALLPLLLVAFLPVTAAAYSIDFSQLTPGTTVEGLGAVDPLLNISSSTGGGVALAEGSGPAGAEKLVADYKHAYLLELRAKLVENTEIALTKRLFEFRQKMAPEVRSYIKGLPPREVPDTLEGMYEAIRRWCDKERAASDGAKDARWTRRRQDRVYEAKEGDSKQGSEQPKEEALNMLVQGLTQALGKGRGKGAKGGKGG